MVVYDRIDFPQHPIDRFYVVDELTLAVNTLSLGVITIAAMSTAPTIIAFIWQTATTQAPIIRIH